MTVISTIIIETGQTIPNALSDLYWDRISENNQYFVQPFQKLCPSPWDILKLTVSVIKFDSLFSAASVVIRCIKFKLPIAALNLLDSWAFKYNLSVCVISPAIW